MCLKLLYSFAMCCDINKYAQVVWAPHRIKYINMIENVQIRATKLVERTTRTSVP